MPVGPHHIVRLTEETTETLYRLGEQQRFVGMSGFTVRPPHARREKPRVSAFLSAKIGRSLALEAELPFGFSDLQADIAGGEDCCREFARRAPDMIVGSGCGKKFRPERVAARPRWATIPAMRNGEVLRIKSSDILPLGPEALTDGLRQVHEIVMRRLARQ